MHFVLNIFGSVVDSAREAGISLQITRAIDKKKCVITKLTPDGVFVDACKTPQTWCREPDYNRLRSAFILQADDEARLLAVMMSSSFTEGEATINEAMQEMDKVLDYEAGDWVTFKALKHNSTFSSCMHRVSDIKVDEATGMTVAEIISANGEVASVRKVPAWQLERFDMAAFKAGGGDWIIEWTTNQLSKTPFGDQLSKHSAESKDAKAAPPSNISEISAFLKNRNNK